MGQTWFVLPGLMIWSAILLLPWRPWTTRESLEAYPEEKKYDLARVTVLIPARNEQDLIQSTLIALSKQGQHHKIILIDDQSTDNTMEIATGLGLSNLTVIRGQNLAPGWSGKLWALEQGRAHVKTDLILLLDADIELKPGTVQALLTKMIENKLQLVSLMAYLRMEKFWEKLLMPAFIYFFKLLYPFHISNSGSRLIAAAAGGCILIDKHTLDAIGGFAALKNELIDDCALARQIKNQGGRTWIGLTHSALSRRPYNDLSTIWQMVTRTAFIQLKYSVALLLLCSLLLISAFLLPVYTVLLSGTTVTSLAAILTLVLMIGSYLPTLKFYQISPLWGLTLPLVGLLYLLMTWNSAINHWLGPGAYWKDRTYAK